MILKTGKKTMEESILDEESQRSQWLNMMTRLIKRT